MLPDTWGHLWDVFLILVKLAAQSFTVIENVGSR